MSSEETKGRVYLVGAGPGALDLVTLRARELILRADVIIYDYLCNPEMLRWARPEAEKIYAGKTSAAHTLTQAEINDLLVDRAGLGKGVVRLKGGDPYLFGRGGEEAQALGRAGVPFEIVPGVTSAIAAPAYAGIPVTHRDFASTVTFVTGHEDPTKTESSIDWAHLARLRGTKVFLMGVERLRQIAQRLMAESADRETPVALVRWGTTGRQESIEGTLATVADLVEARGFTAPAVTVIGEVVKLRSELNWFEVLPLFGQRIVVTRARRQAGTLTKRLTELGADVLEIPTIRIVPVALLESARGKLADMAHHFDWLVFTSPNSVERFFEEYFQRQSDIRLLGNIRLAALGPATGARLRALRLKVDLEPQIYTVEKLAEAFTGVSIADVRFCLPHGNRANRFLADYLRKNGGLLEEWTLYDTEPEPDDLTGARARYLKQGAHWIAFTSASTAENWHALQLQPVVGAPQPRAVSMGPVTSATLRQLGHKIAAEAPAATIDALIATICKLNIE